MNMLPQFNHNQQSMTSLEIAELVQSRHDDVKRSIDRLTERGVISKPPLADGIKGANGVTPKLYIFSGEKGKRDSIIVVAQLCPEFTAALVDRWSELERATTLPQSFSEALQLAADQARQLEIAAPKIQYFDAVADVGNLMTASTVGKKIGMSAQALNAHLVALKVYDMRHKGKLFAQWFIDKGLGEVKKTSNGFNSSKFTNKGEQWIIEKLMGEGVAA